MAVTRPIKSAGGRTYVEEKSLGDPKIQAAEIDADLDTIYAAVNASGDVPAGGAAGQVLAKATDTDFVTVWETPYWQPLPGHVQRGVARAGTAGVLTAMDATPAVEAGYSIALVNPANPAAGQAVFFGDPTTGKQTAIVGTPASVAVSIGPNGTTALQLLADGRAVLGADPVNATDAATKAYVDANAAPPGGYRHVQASAATEWDIVHDLAFRPNVTAVDSTGREMVPGAVEYVDATHVRLTFSVAVGGEAYLS